MGNGGTRDVIQLTRGCSLGRDQMKNAGPSLMSPSFTSAACNRKANGELLWTHLELRNQPSITKLQKFSDSLLEAVLITRVLSLPRLQNKLNYYKLLLPCVFHTVEPRLHRKQWNVAAADKFASCFVSWTVRKCSVILGLLNRWLSQRLSM